MHKETSVYLDFARFVAAFEVFVDHASRQSITGGFLATFGQYGQQAVALFFVISGIVISHATLRRETTPKDYFIARLSRLWSVVVPAIILTIMLDLVGHIIDPGLYNIDSLPPMWGLNLASAVRALAPILFLNQISTWHIHPGTNGPFWSLSYEFWYYVAFGAFCFWRGWRRIAMCTLLCIVMYPRIILLSPLWLMGVIVQRLLGRGRPSKLWWLVWTSTLLSMLLLMAFKYKIFNCMNINTGIWRPIVGKYPISICFAINVVAFDRVSPTFRRAVDVAGGYIRMLARRTFSLYLYQAPLIFFFGALTYRLRDTNVRIAIIYFGALVSVALLSEFTELKRERVSSWLSGLYRWFSSLTRVPASADTHW